MKRTFIMFNTTKNNQKTISFQALKMNFVRMKTSMIFLMVFMMALTSCKVRKEDKANSSATEQVNNVSNVAMATAPVIIYKTKADYTSNIPVVLSDDKAKIVSFPDVADVKSVEGFRTPVRLANSFLLDKQGIGVNTAFVSYTYEEYSNLEQTPTANQLFDMIIDNDPILEIYNCGSKNDFKDIVADLNKAISSNDMSSFKKLK